MKIKVYEYKNCGTCKKALTFLDEKNISYEKFPIRETPPSEKEINSMIEKYKIDPKKLFNTSGGDYREQNIKEKINTLNQKQIVSMLSKNGNLIKRPIVISESFGLVGFKEEEWNNYFN